MNRIVALGLTGLIAGACLLGCGKTSASRTDKQPELLVYCGITMIKPVTDIARVIEQQENCRITITKGGSGNLLRSIKVNEVGDLYLPGSDSYIKTATDEGLVSESVFVGYNKAALMVRKGNPKQITNDLNNLTEGKYYVVIGNPDSGSIGRETKKILERKGIFDEVAKAARRLTTDSKDLTMVLKHQEADLAVNWYATSTWPENEPYIDALGIDEQYASKKKLVLGLLTCSRHPDIARKFMAYAESDAGRALFEKYGLFNVK